MKQIDIDSIVIASPCSVPWESMTGDDVRRYCGRCRLHVYDLSQMSRPEIRRLLQRTGGNFCKRIWRRPDGRILTRDCSRVVRATRRRIRALATALAGLLALVGFVGCGRDSSPSGAKKEEPAPTTPAPSVTPGTPAPGTTVTTGR